MWDIGRVPGGGGDADSWGSLENIDQSDDGAPVTDFARLLFC